MKNLLKANNELNYWTTPNRSILSPQRRNLLNNLTATNGIYYWPMGQRAYNYNYWSNVRKCFTSNPFGDPLRVDGKHHKATELDPNNGEFVYTSFNGDYANSRALSLWFKMDNILGVGDKQGLVYHPFRTNIYLTDFTYACHYENNAGTNRLVLRLRFWDDIYTINHNVNLEIGAWHHLVIGIQPTQVFLGIDGTTITDEFTHPGVSENGVALYLGFNIVDAVEYYLDGAISDVSYWSLTDVVVNDLVDALYNDGDGAFYNDLRYKYYEFINETLENKQKFLSSYYNFDNNLGRGLDLTCNSNNMEGTTTQASSLKNTALYTNIDGGHVFRGRFGAYDFLISGWYKFGYQVSPDDPQHTDSEETRIYPLLTRTVGSGSGPVEDGSNILEWPGQELIVLAYIYKNGSRYLAFKARSTDGGWGLIYYPVTLAINRWHHITIAIYNSKMFLILNNVNLDDSVVLAAAHYSVGTIYVGYSINNVHRRYTSHLYTDEVSIWEDLDFSSDQDVLDFNTELYNSGRGNFINSPNFTS